MTAAKQSIPSSKVRLQIRDFKPEKLVIAYKHLKTTSRLASKFSSTHIREGTIPSLASWHNKLYDQFCQVLIYLEEDPSIIPTTCDLVTARTLRKLFTSRFCILYTKCKLLEQQYRMKSMNDFIVQCCSNYINNQKV